MRTLQGQWSCGAGQSLRKSLLPESIAESRRAGGHVRTLPRRTPAASDRQPALDRRPPATTIFPGPLTPLLQATRNLGSVPSTAGPSLIFDIRLTVPHSGRAPKSPSRLLGRRLCLPRCSSRRKPDRLSTRFRSRACPQTWGAPTPTAPRIRGPFRCPDTSRASEPCRPAGSRTWASTMAPLTSMPLALPRPK